MAHGKLRKRKNTRHARLWAKTHWVKADFARAARLASKWADLFEEPPAEWQIEPDKQVNACQSD